MKTKLQRIAHLLLVLVAAFSIFTGGLLLNAHPSYAYDQSDLEHLAYDLEQRGNILTKREHDLSESENILTKRERDLSQRENKVAKREHDVSQRENKLRDIFNNYGFDLGHL